jgi:hypothetical protein
VAAVLKRSVSGRGVWTPSLGFGVLDAAAAVELAPTIAAAEPAVKTVKKLLRRVR